NGLAESSIPEARVNQLFEMLWPALEKKIVAIPEPKGPIRQNRPQHEILEELVTSVRGLDVRLREDDPRTWRRRRLHPEFLVHSMITIGERVGDRNLSILMLASYFRDEAPWLYELGLEVYRTSQFGGGQSKQAAMARKRFMRMIDAIRHGPLM